MPIILKSGDKKIKKTTTQKQDMFKDQGRMKDVLG